MPSNLEPYAEAIGYIRDAIENAQFQALQDVNRRQLALYYLVGRYISLHTRNGCWGTGAIDEISRGLHREMPGLRGFSPRSLKYMRTFYEEWQEYLDSEMASSAIAESPATPSTNGITNIRTTKGEALTLGQSVPFDLETFLSLGFTAHSIILSKVKDPHERWFYIEEAVKNHFTVETLKRAMAEDDYHHFGAMPNNFLQTLRPHERAERAILSFKDEYLLDFINTEAYGLRDKDVDERLLEKGIVENIKQFILKFGRGFAFVGNQYRIEAFGEEQYVDLLFFNRYLNSLVAVELKTGPFKTAYLGQLSGYLALLDEFVKEPHENPSIGIVLCRDANRAFVDFVIRDYDRPMGVATYKTQADAEQALLETLPPVEEIKALLRNADLEDQ